MVSTIASVGFDAADSCVEALPANQTNWVRKSCFYATTNSQLGATRVSGPSKRCIFYCTTDGREDQTPDEHNPSSLPLRPTYDLSTSTHLPGLVLAPTLILAMTIRNPFDSIENPYQVDVDIAPQTLVPETRPFFSFLFLRLSSALAAEPAVTSAVAFWGSGRRPNLSLLATPSS